MQQGSDDPPGTGGDSAPRDAATSQRQRAPDVSRPPSSRPPSDDEGLDATEIGPSASLSPIISAGGRPSERKSSVAERIERRAQKDPRVGQVLHGRYRLEKPIAKGGMGRVYLATQLQLGRSVAVKVLNAEFRDTDPQFVRRFGIEAAICARLAHPNVVTVHDYGESETGELFMAMELLRGKTLSAAIQKEAPMAPSRTIHIAVQVARALREAHANGIIHRDLKPGNVMLVEAGDDPDFVKVLDFGLVKLFVPEGQAVGLPADEDDLTRAGTLLGSPRYMSPEQIRGETLDPRTDIYSFGIILFQMAAGRPPFTGSGSVDLIYKHIHEKPPRVSEVAHGDCPPELEDIIARCLEKDREKRFASMSDLMGALKAARSSITGIIERPPTDTGPVSRDPSAAVSEVPRPVTADDPTRTGVLAAPASPAREAAFVEAGSTSLPLAADPSRSVVVPRPSRWPVIIGLGGVFASAITLAVVAARPWRESPAPVVAPSTAPRVIELEFRSDPSGATVRSEGTILGVTPFTARFAPALDDRPRVFVAELDGYERAATEQRLDSSRMVMVVLTKAPPPAPDATPSAAPEPTDAPEGEEPEASESASPTKKRGAAARRAAARKKAARDEVDAEPAATDAPAGEAEGDGKKSPRYRKNPYE